MNARSAASRILRRLTRGTTLAALLLGWAGCGKARNTPPPSWSSDGGELGERVRAGLLPGVMHHRFVSATLRTEVGLVVATPPGYDHANGRRHGVVYVFPGIGGDEWSYLSPPGLDGPSARRLREDPARAPILVFANPGDSGGYGPAESVLAEELVAFVDTHYRTITEAAARSLDGFSLGGATALYLRARRPHVFGQAAASSSACYLIEACGALRASLRESSAQAALRGSLLFVGADEPANNREISEELARRTGAELVRIPGVGHDMNGQLARVVAGRPFGERLADFHLTGLTRSMR